MGLTIRYDKELDKGEILASPDVPTYAWSRLKRAIGSVEPGVQIAGSVIVSDWISIIMVARDIAQIRKDYGIEVHYDDLARRLLTRYAEDVSRNQQSRTDSVTEVSSDEIVSKLLRKGFTRRRLTTEQLRDLSRLIKLSHGANFSVPGAGKTTVAFALHLLAQPNSKLLIVAPKNAFSAWEEVLTDCLDPLDPNSDLSTFWRLTGGLVKIRNDILDGHNRYIISYDQLIRVRRLVAHFLVTNEVHLILDESHRMKAGDESQRGSAALAVAPLASRRDILSGTPIPRSIKDMAPQIDFLWPGQGLGERILHAAQPGLLLKPLYVRTTKNELGLGPLAFEFIPIPMSDSQLALYSLLREAALTRLLKLSISDSLDLQAARRSIMRLLQASSNPILIVRALSNGDTDEALYNSTPIEKIHKEILAEFDSPKIVRACDIARELAGQNKKVVIWTSFTHNVERIAELLSDLNAVFIHGGVETGEKGTIETREGRIKQFNDPGSDVMALVANPAACGEGISLHRACHDALYVDRTFNAGHYLQSVDRIHRLGLSPDIVTNVRILESVTPTFAGSIDFSVRRRTIDKLNLMAAALDDPDLRQLALEEDTADAPLDADISLEDIKDIIDELHETAPSPDIERW